MLDEFEQQYQMYVMDYVEAYVWGEALWGLYEGSIQTLIRLHEDSIKALFRL